MVDGVEVMALKPLSELRALLQTTPPAALAERFAGQDVVLIEPYEKGRAYGPGPQLHPGALFMFLPRAMGKPVPVGRDSRAAVLLDHPAVSRLHLVLAFTDQGWKAMDRSSNGSWLDDQRMPKEQAVPLGYASSVRLGRAVVLRMVAPEHLHRYVQGHSGAAPTPAPPVPARPVTPPPVRAMPPKFDFEFGADLPAMPAAPTVRISRAELQAAQSTPYPPAPAPPIPPATPAPPRPPAAPPPPAEPPQKQKVSDDDMEFEFDFDFGNDGKGGFA